MLQWLKQLLHQFVAVRNFNSLEGTYLLPAH